MNELVTMEEREHLSEISNELYSLIMNKAFDECENRINKAIGDFPHAPHPHNLMGILLEATGDKHGAMKHYRAAIALEPSFRPARANLYSNGDLSNHSSDYTV